MKLLHRKAALAACLLFPALVQAQYTETFESVTASGNVKPASFTSNGQTFNLITANCNTGLFGIFVPAQFVTHCSGTSQNDNASYGVGTSCTGSSCTGVSAKFIDNTGSIPNGVTSQIYAIKTANAALFTVKNLFLYLSSDKGLTPSAAGGITFRGKVNGSVVFTFVKTTGFNTSTATSNGFTYIDFASYATTNIDELEIQGGASCNYVSIDNFTFGGAVPLPVNLTAFTARLTGNTVKLDWQSSLEINCAYYEPEKSSDGITFTSIGNVKAGSKTYTYYDNSPLQGNSFYRLHIVDRDGQAAYSPVVALTTDIKPSDIKVFPNPASDELNIIAGNAGQVQLSDMAGRIWSQTRITADHNKVSLQGLARGLYFYRVSADDGTVMGQGKIVKQ